ncbi:carboxypeptidase-like regulatory domain-containing protein [Flavobacterium cucumis]|uniref:CarboxypepD_reg-like domain-containing protein n=1 Tax=Flavobacterium cucumis TaxID=416016 RepID=A0A1M7ZVG9_9FLAO|nr:carboxypeptidase-like regulatory domain-containing protein [Flavobacterium cucumis]SHO72885.1 CarboxypepD_reg-like domain-containing protein [Flavobacterium cucumis]
MLVKGKVTDYEGSPLDSVNVLVVGSNPPRGVITDFNGNFAIDVPVNSVLEFSHVGTNQKMQINVGSKTYFDVALMNELQGQEITIIGNRKNGFNWWWLLLAIPVGYGIGKAFEKNPKKVTI